MKKPVYAIFIFAIAISCQTKNRTVDLEKVKQEVIQVEYAFAQAAKENGVEAAFLEFAANDASINRGNKIFKGKEEIQYYFNHSALTDVTLTWEPDFVDVSDDGTMAYTYGPYTFKAKDAEENPVNAEGLFHTVWKRQVDGSWRFVYD